MSTPVTDPSPAPTESPSVDRRRFLRNAAATGFTLAGVNLLMKPVMAQAPGGAQAIKDILTVARTAEQLAITFYTNGIANAAALGLTTPQLNQLKAALIEEQIHQIFFTAQGGDSLAATFSFPDGASTFTDLTKFIKAQQQLEGAFDSAFVSAVKEFASDPINSPDLAQVAAQIAMIEAEHRALGRMILGSSPANNQAFAPVLLAKVADAPKTLTDAGYLSPVAGNTYAYPAADFTNPSLSPIYQKILFLSPFRGDVNANDMVDVKDATLALRGTVGLVTLDDQQKAASDVNGDGSTDVTDVITILKRVVGLA